MLCLVAQSCLTLWDPTFCSPLGSSVHGNSSGKDTGVDCHALLQGIFPTQGLNLGLPYCRQILYWLSHQGIFLTQEFNRGPLHCRWILFFFFFYLQVDFLPAELPGKSLRMLTVWQCSSTIFWHYIHWQFSVHKLFSLCLRISVSH